MNDDELSAEIARTVFMSLRDDGIALVHDQALAHVAESLLPVVRRYAKHFAAEELQTATNNIRRWAASEACWCGEPTSDHPWDPAEIALCDVDGVVRRGGMHHGTDYACTGSAHYLGLHIRCTSPAHTEETA